jgi:phosphoribosylaminoimidazole-succinocarboxamide synthase
VDVTQLLDKAPSLGSRIAEGKTKILYAVAEPPEVGVGAGNLLAENLAYMVHKDSITAGDGAKRDEIPDKGALSCRTTSAVFRYLEGKGLETHFVCAVGDRTMMVQRVEMIPIEWVARRIAAGSYVRRTGATEGTRFDEPVLEMFYKDDAQHDPLITPEQAVAMGICATSEIEDALALTMKTFLLLEEAWRAQDILLVDLKVEVGRSNGRLLLADVIDNDSWRLWPGGRRDQMLDKQVYRDLQVADAPALADVRARYLEVADRAERLAGTAMAG